MPIYDSILKEWKCKFCHASYYNELSAKGCENNHEIVYIELYREDLQRLMQFMYTKDEKLLTERLIKTLRKYSSGMKGKVV